jgi:hypothetical protein
MGFHTMLAEQLAAYESELTEFSSLVEEVMPPGMLDQFDAQYHPPKFIKLIGDERVCTRCGTYVNVDARAHHRLYHRNLTMAIWMLQGFTLAQHYAAQPKKGKKK